MSESMPDAAEGDAHYADTIQSARYPLPCGGPPAIRQGRTGVHFVQYVPDAFAIDGLFWGALIFLALAAFVCCFFAWKALGWLSARGKVGNDVAEGRVPNIPEIPADPSESWAIQAISRPSGDQHYWEMGSFGGMGGLEGMSQREQEELFSTYAPRKVRKAMKARRKAREEAQKHKASRHQR